MSPSQGVHVAGLSWVWETSICTRRSTDCSCTRTNYGDRSFAVEGPRVWSSLPAELRTPDISLGHVQKQTEDSFIECVTVDETHLWNRAILAL